MKKIGIIGGLGPVATVDYYNEIIGIFNKKDDSMNYPEMIIYSVNISEFLHLMSVKKYDEVVEKFTGYIDSLKKAGAEFAAITANTPHLLFYEIQKKSSLPLISIIEATCEDTVDKRLRRPGLIGTKFTMQNTFYQEVFSKEGIEIIVPEKDDIEFIHEKLFKEIELGIFKDDTRLLLLDIVNKMKEVDHIDGLILGCTEFPLMFKEKSYFGIPFLNTTHIHVTKIVDYCLA